MVISTAAAIGIESTMGALITSMDKLKDTLTETMDFALRAEKASLALGMTFQQTNSQLGGTMEGLRGDMNERFAGAIAGMEVGLQGNTKGLAKLINQQRLTGTQSAKTATAIATLEAGLGLSREKTNEFAVMIGETGQLWGISTDKLVTAVDSLSRTFPAQALAGMGDKLTGAMALLSAELPQGMEKHLNAVMTMVLDTSLEGNAKLAKLGMQGLREQISASQDSKDAAQILKDSFQTGAEKFMTIAGGAENLYLRLGVATDTFGPAAMSLTTVTNGFGKRVKNFEGDWEDFGNQLGTIKQEILQPLGEAFVEFFPTLKELATVLGVTLRDGVLFLVDAGLKLFVQWGGFTGIVTTLKEKFNLFKTAIMDNTKLIKNTLGAAFMYLALKLSWFVLTVGASFVASIVAATFNLTMFTLGLVTLTWPVLAVVAGIGLLVAAVVFLNKKFGFLDPLIGWVSDAFGKLKIGLGEFLISLGNVFGIPDFIAEWGRALTGEVKDTATAVSDAAKEKRQELSAERRHSDVMGAAQDQLAQDANFFGITSTKKDDEIAKPTDDQSQSFLEATANILGREMEGILGIGYDSRADEMMDILEEGNRQRQETAILLAERNISAGNPNQN